MSKNTDADLLKKKLVLDEWIVREVIDTLYMARATFLGITGLDSPQEVAKKSAKETAITRRISKAIDIIQQEQPCEDLDAEIEMQWDSFNKHLAEYDDESEDVVWLNWNSFLDVARYFYELGKKSK